MNLCIDTLRHPLTTRQILTVWEFTIEPHPSWQILFSENPNCHFGNNSVWTLTQTWSDGPDRFLSLLHTLRIMGSMGFSELARFLPQTKSKSRSITISESISQFTSSWPLSVSPTGSITTCTIISTVSQSRHWSDYMSLFNPDHQAHLKLFSSSLSSSPDVLCSDW